MIKAIKIKALGAATLLLSLTAMPSFAQDDWGGVNVRPRRCGTSMMMENEAMQNNGGHRRVIRTSANYTPHSGDVTIPVILVNFKDAKLSVDNPQQAFEQFFNGSTQQNLGNGNQHNYGSVSQYFREMSNGAFNLRFKVYAPVTLANDETVYGGKNPDSSRDENPRQLVKDAVDSLVASGQVSDEDVASFSTDGNTIDCVYVIYAGCGQNFGGDSTTVWANTSMASNTSIGGKSVRWYSMAGELSPYRVDANGNVSRNGTIPMITGVGVTCHELSHALGLPDFYPTSTSAYLDNQEMEYWDLMDGGEYAYNGYCPTAYTAYEKNEMGWDVDINTLYNDQAVTMDKSTEEGGTAYKIVNFNNTHEYFMLELIKRSGWNRHLYGNGLLVYHVNVPDDVASNGMTIASRFNNSPGYPGMAVVPADGACLSSYITANSANYLASMRGDLYPGSNNVDTLNVSELSDNKPQPNFCWYNRAKTEKFTTNKALRNIRFDEGTGILTFNYIDDVALAISNINIDNRQADSRIYSLDGKYVGNDTNRLKSGIYIRGGKKIIK